MDLSDFVLYTPRGVRDLLPDAAKQKAALEYRLARHFAVWGYEPIVTPTFEFMDVLRTAHGAPADENLYRFVDREGHVLALRPEMTVPIARAVASRLVDAPKPLRLHYIGSVFRYDEPQSGRLREFTQAGIELIGAAGPHADAEIIAVTISGMMELGLSDFRMDLGHVGFAASVLRGLGLPPEVTADIRRALLNQDYVGLDELLDAANAAEEARDDLHTLLTLRGDSETLEAAKSIARTPEGVAALESVTEVYRLLEAYGVAGWVRIDLSMVKQMDYYTGIVVEGYTSSMGYTLCTGGRYDTLLGRFGYDAPATGLAIGVERLLLALDRAGVAGEEEPQRMLLLANDGRWAEACSAGWRLRQEGRIVEIDVMASNRDEALAYAVRKGISQVAVFDGRPGDPVELIEGKRSSFVQASELSGVGGVSE